MTTPAINVVRTPIEPFGCLIESQEPDMDLRVIPASTLAEWARAARVLVLRGFSLFSTEELAEYCKRFGELLEWDFGVVLELKGEKNPKNYLFDSGEVPYHWDGAFAGTVPSFMFFQCLEAEGENLGGETTFCDTTWVLADATPAEIATWEQVSITYSTEKIAHYGGQFTAPMLSRHPVTGEQTIRYAEPVPETFLNPVYLQIEGIPEGSTQEFINGMHERLHHPSFKYAHEWRKGDILISDNHANVHGRNPFKSDGLRRHLQRVEII
jgi:alpha-ketoglutarate-dependent taurine dioxygenase